MVQKTILLSLDECDLIPTAIKWLMENILSPKDSLILAASAHPSLPPGKSTDGFIEIRKKEAELVKQRLEKIAGIIDKKLGKNIQITVHVGIWKIAQGDHIYEMYEKFQPHQVFLFLDPGQQPWISRTFHGSLASQLSKRIPNAVVISPDVLKRFEDQDIFGF